MRQQRVNAILDDVAKWIEKFFDRVTITGPLVEISFDLLVKNSRLSACALVKRAYAPFSMNGTCPALSIFLRRPKRPERLQEKRRTRDHIDAL